MQAMALLLAAAPTLASVTQCWKDGKTAPCGPGNDQCGPPQVPPHTPHTPAQHLLTTDTPAPCIHAEHSPRPVKPMLDTPTLDTPWPGTAQV